MFRVNNLRIYGFFYSELKENHFYWDFQLMGVKVLIAFIGGVYFENEGIKLSLITFVLFIQILITERIQPYIRY